MKKKILLVTLVVCVLAMTIASTTMAYFTDTKSITNTFTVGDVKIELTEAAVMKDNPDLGHWIQNESADRIPANNQEISFGNMFPMQNIYKDPTIQNTGSENAYVAAIITIDNGAGTIDEVLTVTGETGKTSVDNFLTGLVQNDDRYFVTFTEVKDENEVVTAFKVYIIKKVATVTNEKVTLFTGIQVPATWNNTQMAYCNGLKITVEAYATQQAGFADAKTAIQTAFANEFGSITFATNP